MTLFHWGFKGVGPYVIKLETGAYQTVYQIPALLLDAKTCARPPITLSSDARGSVCVCGGGRVADARVADHSLKLIPN